MATRKGLADVELNKAFGLATILASLDAAKHIVAFDIANKGYSVSVFFIFFFVFRVKMYVDDSNHEFDKNKLLDIVIAVSSWIAFIFSAYAIEKSIPIAVRWFIVGLVISTIWIIYSYLMGLKDETLAMHVHFLRINLAVIVVLATFLQTHSTPWLFFGILIVAYDWLVMHKASG